MLVERVDGAELGLQLASVGEDLLAILSVDVDVLSFNLSGGLAGQMSRWVCLSEVRQNHICVDHVRVADMNCRLQSALAKVALLLRAHRSVGVGLALLRVRLGAQGCVLNEGGHVSNIALVGLMLKSDVAGVSQNYAPIVPLA